MSELTEQNDRGGFVAAGRGNRGSAPAVEKVGSLGVEYARAAVAKEK
jgi:hypothetical protein